MGVLMVTLFFWKAFDTVNHDVLHSLPTIILKYRKGRTQRVSRRCNVEGPQGSMLGPLLFVLFISRFPDFCRGGDIQMYVNDTVL